jgi:beta-glucosidase-like glycosyl hydrolase/CubicO group peptidase (beta-lactamase class C family)
MKIYYIRFKKPAFIPLIFLLQISSAQIPFYNPQAEQWADSVLLTMTLEERVGQLFMAYSRSDREAKPDSLADIIRKYHIGGIMFLKGSPLKQAELTNFFQDNSKLKMLIAIDAEWGLQMRLDSTQRFPRQMTIGAMPFDSSAYFMGAEIARQCKRLGIHINFAPVIDINNNALNPVINTRSFGESKELVARLGLLYMKGLQDNGVLACGKHFPGHGNTDTDSHYALPVINQSRAEMDTMELYPFAELFKNGLGSVMVAHLFIPALDSTSNRASTLSPLIVQKLLKDSMGYKGLVFTDALNMKGVSDYYKPGELESLALAAGNDMLLYSDNIPVAFDTLMSKIKRGEMDSLEINNRVKKILMVKHWCGLNDYKPVNTQNLFADLNRTESLQVIYGMYANAITLLKNKKDILPLTKLHKNKIASLVINDTLNNPFQFYISRYAPVTLFRMSKDADSKTLLNLTEALTLYDQVIISIHNTNTRSGNNFGITSQMNDIISRLNNRVKTVTVLFGNAYCLNYLPAADKSDALILSYEDTWAPQWATAQVIFGARSTYGTLPVTTNSFDRGAGEIMRDYRWRLRFDFPENAGLSSSLLQRIDSIAVNAIDEKVFPGCQVLAVKNGAVIYEKAFGFHTYDNITPVKTTDLYDLASVTKILAAALACMKLYEEEKLDLDKKASRYLPELKGTNKENLTIRSLMTHTSGLQAWIPFYKKALQKENIFSRLPSDTFSIQLTDSLWMDKRYREVIWKEIIASPVNPPGTYVYSDLGMIILQKIIEKITGQPLDEYVTSVFYQPLGLHRLMYNPLHRFNKSEIVPTEIDTVFRMQLIHGYVHDPAAAMMGGVAAHAGLFSDAYSVAVIMQMLLNKGMYGGIRFLKEETIEQFTKRQSPTHRRALIFDRPDEESEKNPVAPSASSSTFGHQGFTGTCAWADPENGIIFVFLSNRVYPSASNNQLSRKNIRPQMMEVIYKSFSRQ